MNEPTVNDRTVHDLAALISGVDPDNKMDPCELGWRIQEFVDSGRPAARQIGADLPLFVERTNLDKRMGAGQLAELVVAEFGLDEER